MGGLRGGWGLVAWGRGSGSGDGVLEMRVDSGEIWILVGGWWVKGFVLTVAGDISGLVLGRVGGGVTGEGWIVVRIVCSFPIILFALVSVGVGMGA